MTRVVRLEHDDVCVVVDVSGGVPAIMHWGAALGAVDTDTFAALTNRPTTHGSLDVVPRCRSCRSIHLAHWPARGWPGIAQVVAIGRRGLQHAQRKWRATQ